MVGKQGLVVMALILVFSFPVGMALDVPPGSGGPANHDPHCNPGIDGELLPYGTKVTSGFTSPALHTARLVYHIQGHMLEPGHNYQLFARNPITATVPDFDIVFEVPGGTVLHNNLGTDTGTVPQNAIRAYVFMPIGPDLAVAPGNPLGTAGHGAFTYEHC